jgi:phosphoribosylaminoimidazole (AIR) synthetase
MGVGLVIAVAEPEVERAGALLAEAGEPVHRIGRIVAGTPGVVYA